MRLAVELSGTIVEHLDGDDSQSFDFRATDEAIDEFGINSNGLKENVMSFTTQLLQGRPAGLAIPGE